MHEEGEEGGELQTTDLIVSSLIIFQSVTKYLRS